LYMNFSLNDGLKVDLICEANWWERERWQY